MKIYDISGEWSFCLDPEKKGTESGFINGGFDDTITLPNTVSAAEKSPITDEINTGYLTDPRYYEGQAWFSRRIDIDGYDPENVYTLLLERTRVSYIWIDGEFAGSSKHLCTSHRYDISRLAKSSFTLTVMTDNTDYPTRGGHMTSPDTQTNWNGILGKIEIISEKKGVIRDISVTSDTEKMEAVINFSYSGGDLSAVVSCKGAFEPVTVQLKEGINSVRIKCADGAKVWSEFSPKTYTVKITAENGNEYTAPFGIRKLSVFKRENGSYGFKMNGRETFMRGKHDGMIFPMTGYAPMDTDGWIKVMKTAKDYGINHYRFHTCCPPEAAFEAADMLGIYMEPELPFWGTIHGKDDKDFNAKEQEYLIEEGFKILREFGSHPSFLMMSLGNELWGSAERISEIIGGFKECRSDILYTGGSNNFQFFPTDVPNEDFFVGVRFDKEFLIRGSYAMCDAPQGFIQTEKPNMSHDYDVFFRKSSSLTADENGEIEIQFGTGVKKVKTFGGGGYIPPKPVISHEVGQYVTAPDINEPKKYTGVLKARNMEVFKERLEAAGLIDFAEENRINSGKLAADCYKTEIEAARRSRCLSGYQLLDIQDFTGQGTALVGILDAFMESKGTVTLEKWRGFNAETVLLAEFDSFVLYSGDTFEAKIIVSHFGDKDLSGENITVEFMGEKITLDCGNMADCGVYTVGTVKFNINADKCCKSVLRLEMGDIRNEYDMYIFTKEKLSESAKKISEGITFEVNGVTVTADIKTALDLTEENKKVLLVTDKMHGIESTYCTDFWCYPMFRGISESMGKPVPVGTLGLSIDKSHSALDGFVTDTYTSPQWYDIISAGKCAVLDKTGIKPIVRTIDNFERNHNLGILFEAKCGGQIMVCAVNPEVFGRSVEAAAYFDSILKYVTSDLFVPKTEITQETLTEILKEE